MPNPSNLYAEKVFSEHPIALWALDEAFLDGSHDETVSNIKNVSQFNAVRAKAYGLENKYGYYVGSSSDTFYSKNAGIPMVYGASNVTSIFPNETDSQPSLLVPGCGFLNSSGRFQDITLEAWLRINSNTSELKRIIGPVASTDGLYVEKSFLILKVGNNVSSHFVSEWAKPMLIHIQSTRTGAALTINGEQVLSMNYEYPVTFPNVYDNNLEQDWIAFYAYSDIPFIEIDAVAIYPYAISSVVAKRRFVYGQGVVYPNNVNTAYGGTATLIDYSFANYSKNYNYPTVSGWSSGEIENLLVNGDFLSLPDYSLPSVVTSRSKSEWLSDLYDAQSDNDPKSFISLRPNSDYDSGYIKFDSLNVTKNPVKSLFGIFEPTQESLGGTLFRIQNKFNGDYLDASLSQSGSGYEVEITSSISGVVSDIGLEGLESLTIDGGLYSDDAEDQVDAGQYNTESWDLEYDGGRLFNIPTSTNIAVGFNIESLISKSALPLSDFFKDPDNLTVYVGGTETVSDTFDGKIYGFSFADEYSTKTITDSITLDSFDEDTGLLFAPGTNLINFISTYTLTTNIIVDQIILDIAIAGYWQDHFPMSFLSKTVDDESLALDMIQFNINFPKNGIVDPNTNEITTQNMFKSFVGFQTIESNAQENFGSIVPANENSVIQPGPEWVTSKYEVLDNHVIYPPDVADVSILAMTIRLEYLVEGIFKYPITIKSLDFASQAYNKNSETFIGTRFGTTLTPYSETSYNPYLIYKGSTPYLYMTDKSGIRLVGDFDTDRGLRLNINEARSESFNVSYMQIGLKSLKNFDEEDMLIFETVSLTNHLRFYLIQESSSQAIIECRSVNSSGVESDFTDIQFYINGSNGNSLYANEWAILGVRFNKPEDFGYQNNQNNAINLLGPLLFNNLSYYRVSDTEIKQRTAKISWNLIARDESNNPYTWNNWSSSVWKDIMFERYEDIPSIDPESVYKMYLGTNKIISGYGSTRQLNLSGYQYVFYTKTAWQPEIIKPV
jgi:hypothetical protein